MVNNSILGTTPLLGSYRFSKDAFELIRVRTGMLRGVFPLIKSIRKQIKVRLSKELFTTSFRIPRISPSGILIVILLGLLLLHLHTFAILSNRQESWLTLTILSLSSTLAYFSASEQYDFNQGHPSPLSCSPPRSHSYMWGHDGHQI